MDSPIFCRKCGNPDTWTRNPAGDVKGAITGIAYWQGYKCTTPGCGNKTIIETGPADIRLELAKVGKR